MNKEELIGKLQMVYVGDKNALNELIYYYDVLKLGIERVQQENKKQKELIDKAVLELANIDGNLSNSQLSDRICNLIDILKEVK